MKDDKTSIKELKELVHKFNTDRDWDQFHNAKDLATIHLDSHAIKYQFCKLYY